MILVMLATGAAVGFVNGAVYVWGRLPHPFIITLATLSIARGLALQLSGGQPKRGMPAVVRTHRQRLRSGGCPYSAFLVAGHRRAGGRRAVPAGVGALDLRRPAATPKRPAAPASRSGRCSSRSTCCAGCWPAWPRSSPRGGSTPGRRRRASWPSSTRSPRSSSVAPASSAAGATVANALVGALMIGVIRNGMNLLNVDAFLQPIVIGVVIVLAVESDVLRARLEERLPGAPGGADMTGGARPSAARPSGSARCWRSTRSTSRCSTARCWRCSATTAPASRR